MPPLNIYEKSNGLKPIEEIYRSLEHRLSVGGPLSCPVEFTSTFVRLASSQSCGKCVPCRVGLAQLVNLVDQVLDGAVAADAADDTLKLIEDLAEHIYLTSDCAIGYEAAAVAYRAVKGFEDDFRYHLEHNDCKVDLFASIPCRSGCPAGVDVPGYISLVAQKRYDDAVMLIRKDNPFAVACAYICEHPCELYCRRGMVDDPINIRGIKRFATDHARNGTTPVSPPELFPFAGEPTGKTVAVIGGGPSGLSAAFYLTLMGHTVTVYDQHKQLGGMMRYGIPAYRLARAALDAEIDYLTQHGINVKLGVSVGADISFEDLRAEHDALLLAFGASAASMLGIPGEEAAGVISALEMLRAIGDDEMPDFSGKSVVVVGGGNVAMDVARSAVRFGADEVTIAYRRRKEDMTAGVLEIEGALAEGCTLLDLHAPVSIATHEGAVSGIVLQPQIISTISYGRANNKDAVVDPVTLNCDIVLVAIGQRVDSTVFETAGIAPGRNRIRTERDTSLADLPGVFAAGDCVTGPATVIRAVAAGKAAARAIDSYLGFSHPISLAIDIPSAFFSSRIHCARSNLRETFEKNLQGNFALIEQGFFDDEATQEASRCLRCDHFGLGGLREGRSLSW